MKRILTIRRHKERTVRNVFGDVVEKRYYYTIAYRKFLFWRHFRFYMLGNKFDPPVKRCLEAKSVSFREGLAFMATRFYDEEDAIKVKQDMLQNPNKYTT